VRAHRSALRSNLARIRDITGLLYRRAGQHTSANRRLPAGADPQGPHASRSCALSGRSAVGDGACRI